MKDDIKNKIKQIVVSAILLIVCVFVTKKFELKIRGFRRYRKKRNF